jgi:hypothetical protein
VAKSRAREPEGKDDKADLRSRFTSHREAPVDDVDDEHVRLASELSENVGKTVKAATELGLVIAETVGLKLMEMVSPAKPSRAATSARTTAASVLGTAKEKLPEFSGQTASMLTDLVVNRGFAALRAVQQTVRTTRRQG